MGCCAFRPQIPTGNADLPRPTCTDLILRRLGPRVNAPQKCHIRQCHANETVLNLNLAPTPRRPVLQNNPWPGALREVDYRRTLDQIAPFRQGTTSCNPLAEIGVNTSLPKLSKWPSAQKDDPHITATHNRTASQNNMHLRAH